MENPSPTPRNKANQFIEDSFYSAKRTLEFDDSRIILVAIFLCLDKINTDTHFHAIKIKDLTFG